MLAALSHVQHIGAMPTDPHAELRDRAFRSVYEGEGHSDPALRQAVRDGTDVPAELRTLVEKIRHHAYSVTDEDFAPLRARYTEDQLFEIVVSAAVGASRMRLFAGLAALEKA